MRALLAAALACACVVAVGCVRTSPAEAREAALREDLHAMRATLDQYRADKGHSPESLDDLVREGYLRSIPYDPMTRSRDTWRVVTATTTPMPGRNTKSVVLDVRSGAAGVGSDGRPYREW